MESTVFALLLLICGLLLLCHFIGNVLFTCGMIQVRSVNTLILQNLSAFSLVLIIHVLIGHEVMHGVFNPASRLAAMINGLFKLVPIHQNFQSDLKSIVPFFQALLPCISVSLIASMTVERLRLVPFLLFTVILTVLIFPVPAYWIWGRSWLMQYGFVDHSGSSLVYLIGALAGLTGTLILGPSHHLKSEASNVPLAFQGMFLICLGCFGFNVGTYLMQYNHLYFDKIALFFINNCLALAAGVLMSTFLSRLLIGMADLTVVFNGAIAGMVAISPMPFYESGAGAILIGGLAGSLGLLTTHLLNALKIEDPAGTFSSFGLGIILGLCVIPTSRSFIEQVSIQLTGITLISLWILVTSSLSWLFIRSCIGLHYGDPEIDLDIIECGHSAYPQFQTKCFPS